MSSQKIQNLGDRILFLVKKFEGGNQKAFANKCSISPNTLNRYINGRDPKVSYLIPIWENYNINLHWLLTGDGETFINNPDENIKRNEFEKELSILRNEIDVLKGNTHFHKKGNVA